MCAGRDDAGWQARCPPTATKWGCCSCLPAASGSPKRALGLRSGKSGPGLSGLAPQSLGPRLSHISAQKGTGANSGGRRSLVAGSREPPTFKRSCSPESCTSQLMRAQTPVHNHQKGGKIEAQCLGIRRVILVSFLLRGLGLVSRNQPGRRLKNGVVPTAGSEGQNLPEAHCTWEPGASEVVHVTGGRGGWAASPGCLAERSGPAGVSGDTRGKPRLRIQAHAGSGDRS